MILVVGLSSAWQRTLFFKSLHPGSVNRATRVLETASGKGVNVARVASMLGEKTLLLTTAGGHRGKLFRKSLREARLPAVTIPSRGETRLCQTLIANGLVTELVEEAPALSLRELAAVRSAYDRALRKTTLVVLSGTLPKGCGDDFYAELARLATRRNIPVLVDAQKETLRHVVRQRPILVKINAAELAEATGIRTLSEGMRELNKMGAGLVVISRGAKATIAFDGKHTWRVTPPGIKAVNPIGSGDAMMAGIATGLMRGISLSDALRLGIACGAANALTETSGVVHLRDVNRFLRQP